MEAADLTQCTQNTQGAYDPRRQGRNNSGLSEADISDVMCILHPCSPAAFKLVAATAERAPHNVLQNDGFHQYEDNLTQSALEEQETFIINSEAPHQAMDLALRFSTPTKTPRLGFIFGRNSDMCDIVMPTDTLKRVSNIHFSIYLSSDGVLMLQDMSTNGTIVDDVVLKGKIMNGSHCRMLQPGSIIQILSPRTEEIVKFIVRIPSREGYFEEYQAKVDAYLRWVATAEAQAKEANFLHVRPAAGNLRVQSMKTPLVQNQHGMHWSGSPKYNVIGQIGKGAFAVVYQLATKDEGQLFAAKELEKRRFMKDGVLDRKLDNEMQIMKTISHKNIVQYVDYHDHENHLYIIMEFVPCGDLQQYLNGIGPKPIAMPEKLARKMAAQVLDALAYLHKNNITHRDIKPDNILISNLDPDQFTVKLSDFGLSKVVKDTDTFLKTFCGTLLYCAPEVFPMYNDQASTKGKKRPRKAAAPPPKKFHSYSQSVDIWSFGAVLWYALCVSPPFEGVADNTGKGMFDQIMKTHLDVTPLQQHRVSDDAINLLVEMLNTDPASRPSPAYCIRYPWFGFDQSADDAGLRTIDIGLGAIAEEEEGEADEKLDVSSLSLDEQGSSHNSHTSEVSIHSGSLEFFDPRHSKRFKSARYAYREHDQGIDSSPELFHDNIPIIHQPETGQASAPPGRQKLFGEISQGNLGDSAVLGRAANKAVRMSNTSGDSINNQSSIGSAQQAQEGAAKVTSASPSLLGAESMVRELNMTDAPHLSGSQGSRSNGPITPRTPAAASNVFSANGTSVAADDTTPKQPQKPFNRQINIPLPPSFWYDPNDPSTHNLEYASKVSGQDFVSNTSYVLRTDDPSLPATMNGSATDNDDDDLDLDEGVAAEQHVASPEPTLSQFIKPPPRVGRLVSTADSFTPITINISTKISIWGRNPSNTHVFPDPNDVRVPKRGVIISFHARNPEPINEEDPEWPKRDDLYCVITTDSSQGIHINGVLLKKGEPGNRQFGRIYTGDEIQVAHKSQDGKKGLKFTCEFYHGEAKQNRPNTVNRFHVEHEGGRPRAKSKGKERERENLVAAAA